MRSIYAFFLGVLESKCDYCTRMDDYILNRRYNAGRSVGRLLTQK